MNLHVLPVLAAVDVQQWVDMIDNENIKQLILIIDEYKWYVLILAMIINVAFMAVDFIKWRRGKTSNEKQAALDELQTASIAIWGVFFLMAFSWMIFGKFWQINYQKLHALLPMIEQFLA